MTRRVILDVSSNNGHVDVPGLVRRFPEVAGGIVKATEADNYTNPLFGEQYDAFANARLPVGAYAFAHPRVNGVGDVRRFEDVVGNRPLRLGAWWDCEVNDGLDPVTTLQRFLEDMRELDKRYPRKDGLYTGAWFWDPDTSGTLTSGITRYPGWFSGYGVSVPPIPAGWRNCFLWQFTDNYNGTGIDASLFMGDDTTWSAWTGTIAPPPGPAPSPVSDKTKAVQRAVHATADGVWGPDTDRRCESVRAMRDQVNRHNSGLVRLTQATLGVATDGIWGNQTGGAWEVSVHAIQAALGVAQDGVWGPGTDAAYLAASPTR